MLVAQAEHAKRLTALVSVHGILGCVVDLSYLPSKDSLGRRAQMPSGRALTIELPALRTKKSCRGTCKTESCITVPCKDETITYNLRRVSQWRCERDDTGWLA